jgi:hypothetical protein
MIRRETADGWLLISQVDHAQLAGDLAAAWGNDRVPGLPLAEWLVPAVRDHDEGWRTWEATPTVTKDGRPRQFAEMPAAEAMAIWSTSIDLCASGPPSSAEALRRLRAEGGEVTPDDAVVLDAVLRHRGSFGAERLTADIVAEDGLTAEPVAASLNRFEVKGLIRRLPVVVGGPAYEITLPAVGGSPLGGVWVSRHFCALAELAKEHRAGRPEEVEAAKAFLAEQAAKQMEWSSAASDFAGEELERVLDTGSRYVRFFDAISLWLCCAEQDEPATMPLSSFLSLTLTPRNSREIAVEPWPFGPAALELAAPAVRLPEKPFAGDEALRTALGTAEPATLRWVLTRA